MPGPRFLPNKLSLQKVPFPSASSQAIFTPSKRAEAGGQVNPAWWPFIEKLKKKL